MEGRDFFLEGYGEVKAPLLKKEKGSGVSLLTYHFAEKTLLHNFP